MHLPRGGGHIGSRQHKGSRHRSAVAMPARAREEHSSSPRDPHRATQHGTLRYVWRLPDAASARTGDSRAGVPGLNLRQGLVSAPYHITTSVQCAQCCSVVFPTTTWPKTTIPPSKGGPSQSCEGPSSPQPHATCLPQGAKLTIAFSSYRRCPHTSHPGARQPRGFARQAASPLCAIPLQT